jgi:hypothetical protein
VWFPRRDLLAALVIDVVGEGQRARPLLDRVRLVRVPEAGDLVAAVVVDEAGADGAIDDRQFWPILPSREIVWPMFRACKALELKEKKRFSAFCWPMSWPICVRPCLAPRGLVLENDRASPAGYGASPGTTGGARSITR